MPYMYRTACLASGMLLLAVCASPRGAQKTPWPGALEDDATPRAPSTRVPKEARRIPSHRAARSSAPPRSPSPTAMAPDEPALVGWFAEARAQHSGGFPPAAMALARDGRQ